MKITHASLKNTHTAWSISASLALSLCATSAFAQPTQPAPTAATSAAAKASASDLAAKLTNPVADLISVPFQYNYDANIGLDKKGTSNSFVVQPVIPVKLNSSWNYILRPVVTLQQQNNINGFSGTGAGPILIETFFSPSNTGDFIWGVGPIVSTPSLSGNNYGTSQTGVGVSAADDDDAAVVYLAVLNRAIADVGCIGIKGPYIISEMSDPYPVDGVQMVTFTFQPAAGAIDLQKVKITT